MLSRGLPQVNFQFENKDAYRQLMHLVEEHMPPELTMEQKAEEQRLEEANKSNKSYAFYVSISCLECPETHFGWRNLKENWGAHTHLDGQTDATERRQDVPFVDKPVRIKMALPRIRVFCIPSAFFKMKTYGFYSQLAQPPPEPFDWILFFLFVFMEST